MSASENRELQTRTAMAVVAHCATSKIGDGCFVWGCAAEPAELVLMAADHRDPIGRERCQELVGERLAAERGDWLAQALRCGVATHPPVLDVETLLGCGLPERGRIGDLILIPARGVPVVMVAVRDRISTPFSDRDRIELRRIANRLGTDLNAAGPMPWPDWARGEPGGAATASELLEQAAAAIWVTDPGGVTLRVNRAACELVGLPAARIVGVPLAEFVDCEQVLERSATGMVSESSLLRSAGDRRRITVATRRIVDGAGMASGSVHTVIDIGDRHATEVELRTRLDRELAKSAFARYLLTGPAGIEAARRAVEMLNEHFGAPLVLLGESGSGGSRLSIVASAGQLAESHPTGWLGEHHLPEGTPARAAMELGEPVRVGEFGGEYGYRRGPLAEAAGMHSAAWVPYGAGGGASSCIGVMRPQANGICDGELAMLKEIATLLQHSGRALRAPA